MAFEKITWVNEETPLNAENMNRIEAGIDDTLILDGVQTKYEAMGWSYSGSKIISSLLNFLANFLDYPTVSKSTGSAKMRANRTDTGVGVELMVGSGGTAHGLWSDESESWIVYRDGSDVYLNGADMSVKTLTPTISRTSGGSVSNVYCRRYGKVMQLNFTVTSNTTYASGSDLFVGSIPSGYRPAITAKGIGFYGARSAVASLSSSGELTVRNASSQSITPSEGVAISMTYILPA